MVKLIDILENKKREIELEKKQESIEQLKEKIKTLPPTRDFLGSLSKNRINIIAETKIKSPTSPKELNGKTMYELAKCYDKTDVAAISVLTDKLFFAGTNETMKKIKENTVKPILRKDFIIDEYQIYQSRVYGADAILLISSVLSKEKIRRFIELSRELGMECLVEFNSEKDLDKIPKIAKIYGRNYRIINFKTDFENTDIHEDIHDFPSYIEGIPINKIKVAESCITKKEDIDFLKEEGFNAFLIGTALTQANDIERTIEEFVS